MWHSKPQKPESDGATAVPNEEHEQTLNVWLAELLRDRGIDAKQERKQAKGKRVDVDIRLGTVKIALEAKQGQRPNNRRDAIRSADGRFNEANADCVIALCYPQGINSKEALLDAAMMWTIRNPESLTPADSAIWTTSALEDLVLAIKQAPMQLGNPDKAAAGLSASLNAAVERLSEAQKEEIAKALDLPQGKSTRMARGSTSRWNQAAKRAMLVIATAIMFHSRLDNFRNELKPEFDSREPEGTPFKGEWPPAMAQQCSGSEDPIAAFYEAWELWLAVDYKPIFATALTALYGCPQDHAFTEAVKETADAALTLTRDIAGLRHDLLGRIFHTVLDTAKYDGSFYTSTPAATMLATLAINEETCDFRSPKAIRSLRITDPACGTGTLLMTAGERVRELIPETLLNAETDKTIIEEVLRGYDVNLTATHMAATTLGLLSPTTAFKNMKIGRALLGVDQRGNTYLGSLEFLGNYGSPRLLKWPTAVTQIDTEEEINQAEPTDIVIMNPPFTRDSLRHDQFSKAEEKKLKDREKFLFGNKPTYMAGQSGAFLFLGEYLCKNETGTLAAVIPLTGTTDTSGLGMRRYLAQGFHVETIVASQDPERVYFSENTDIGEALLICRRWPSGKNRKPPTRIVNLARNPSTPAEARTVAQIIANGLVEAEGYGTTQWWPAERIEAGDWNGVQFLQPYLCRQSTRLRDGELFNATTLNNLADVGPEGRRTRDAYAKLEMPDKFGRTALWDHDTEVTQSMERDTDSSIGKKKGKEHLADKYWEQRSRLLLPNRLRLNTVRAMCVRLRSPAVGSAWSPCNIIVPGKDKEALEKALCVYLNSSVGVLAMASNRTSKDISYPRFSLSDLRGLPVPDLRTLDDKAIKTLIDIYEKQAAKTMKPLTNLKDCSVRKTLDAAVAEAMGIDPEEVETICRNLAAEPAITGKRFGS